VLQFIQHLIKNVFHWRFLQLKHKTSDPFLIQIILIN
jgi:hypothetical protein